MQWLRNLLVSMLLLLLSTSLAQTCNTGEFQWPVSGPTGREQGDVGPRVPPTDGASSYHQGLDFGVPKGTPVFAAGGGRVTVTPNAGGAGNMVVIDHPNGTVTRYFHLDSFNVKTGDTVKQGQQIARSGSTGVGTAEHLHFEIQAANGERAPMVGGQFWDKAAGLTPGQQVRAGECIKGIAQGGLSPGGPVDPAPNANQGGAANPGNQNGNQPPANNGVTNQQVAEEARKKCEGVDRLLNSPAFDPDAGVGPPRSDTRTPEQKEADIQRCIQQETENVKKELEKKVRLGEIPTGVPEELKLENILPTPEAWMAETNSLLDKYKIPDHALNLGIALLFAGFVYSLTSLMRAHKSDELFLLFGRLIIAAGLLMAAPTIRTGSETVWKGAYDVMKANVVKPATDDLQKGLNDLYPLLTSLTSIAVASKFVAALIPDVPIVDAAEEGVTAVGDLSQQSARGLFGAMLALGGLYGVYFLAIYGSGMILILGATLLPVLMAFLVIPGMASWFSKWFAMMATSFLMVIVFPLLFAVIVSLGVNKPMERVNKELSGVQQTAQDFVRTLNSMPEVNIQNTWALGDWAKDAIVQMTEISSKLILVAVPLTLSLVLLIISIGASMYLMQQMPGILSGFIGGSAGSAASVGGGAGAAFAGGLAAVSNYAGSRGSQTQKAISGPVRGAIGAKKFADKVIANTPTKDDDKKDDSKKDGKDSSKKDSAPPGGSKDKSTSGDSSKDKSSSSPSPTGNPSGGTSPSSSSSPNGEGGNASESAKRADFGRATLETPSSSKSSGSQQPVNLGKATLESSSSTSGSSSPKDSSSQTASSSSSSSPSGSQQSSSSTSTSASQTSSASQKPENIGKATLESSSSTGSRSQQPANAGTAKIEKPIDMGQASIERKQLAGSSNAGALPAAGQTGPVLKTRRGRFKQENEPDSVVVDVDATTIK